MLYVCMASSTICLKESEMYEEHEQQMYVDISGKSFETVKSKLIGSVKIFL